MVAQKKQVIIPFISIVWNIFVSVNKHVNVYRMNWGYVVISFAKIFRIVSVFFQIETRIREHQCPFGSGYEIRQILSGL